MQSTIAFVLLFSLWTISFAADVTVYNSYTYYNGEPQTLEPVAVSQFPWKFGYVDYSIGAMFIRIINKSPNVTAIDVIGTTDEGTFEFEKKIAEDGSGKREEYYHAQGYDLFRFSKLRIILNLYTSNILCSTLLIADGRNLEKITNDSLKDEYPHYDRASPFLMLVVDLINKYDGGPSGVVSRERKMSTTTTTEITSVTDVQTINTVTYNSSTILELTTKKNSAIDIQNAEQPSHNLLIYVIPSVIGMCVILLVIYLLWVNKCCRRNPPRVETLQSNADNFEPFYLNMLFRRECDHEIAEIDQHHYEEISPQISEGG